MNETEMIKHIEKNGWKKCEKQNAWKRKNWKEQITRISSKFVWGKPDELTGIWNGEWKSVERTEELDPDGFFVANLKTAYRTQLKIES